MYPVGGGYVSQANCECMDACCFCDCCTEKCDDLEGACCDCSCCECGLNCCSGECCCEGCENCYDNCACCQACQKGLDLSMYCPICWILVGCEECVQVCCKQAELDSVRADICCLDMEMCKIKHCDN